MVEGGRRAAFSLALLLFLFVWLLTLFAVLWYKAYAFIVPLFASFILLNIATGAWLSYVFFPVRNSHYKKALVIQTVFAVVWCPVLGGVIVMQAFEWVLPWAAVLIAFYAGIGAYSRVYLKDGAKQALHFA